MSVRIRRYPSELPGYMRKALRRYEMSTADENGRLDIQQVIFVGRVESHETAEPIAEEVSNRVPEPYGC